MKRLLILFVRGYQLLTAWTPPVCRYTPSCSRYAIEALDRHGAVRGTALAARRIVRCHPWREGGFDPVPEASRSPGDARRTR
ncbi:MAG: membrane protein insertion efficiency factor YidD [Gemmatimonadetes bacterium]|nr:membrane protein insertion efficiency factor YidD [Gemmatimonadota bacterium]